MAKRKSSKTASAAFKLATRLARIGARRDVLKGSKKSNSLKKMYKSVEG